MCAGVPREQDAPVAVLRELAARIAEAGSPAQPGEHGLRAVDGGGRGGDLVGGHRRRPGEHGLGRTAEDDAEPAAATAGLAASQIFVVLRELADANQRRIIDSRSADELAPVALAEADHAFRLLRGGLTPYA
jgi:hypothetical protein